MSFIFCLPLFNTIYHFTYIWVRTVKHSISYLGHIRILIDVAKFFQAYFDRIFIHKLSTFVNELFTIVHTDNSLIPNALGAHNYPFN